MVEDLHIQGFLFPALTRLPSNPYISVPDISSTIPFSNVNVFSTCEREIFQHVCEPSWHIVLAVVGTVRNFLMPVVERGSLHHRLSDRSVAMLV